MSITRLSGGLTPADGSDPRTFPTIFNDAADFIEDIEAGSIGGTAVYRYVDTVYYTSNGTFSKGDYPWLRAIRVKCVGGGGGGGGTGTTGAGVTTNAASGGGGAYAESFITDIAGLDASVTVTRGNAGAGGAAGANAGSNGGQASFGALVAANGGFGGVGSGGFAPPVAGNVSPGGQGGTGQLVKVGGPSEARISAFAAIGEAPKPGDSGFSVNNIPGFFTFSSVSGETPAVNQAIGCGGRAAAAAQSQSTAQPGGAGAPGIVIVELYA
jgi:hypothetical protein